MPGNHHTTVFHKYRCIVVSPCPVARCHFSPRARFRIKALGRANWALKAGCYDTIAVAATEYHDAAVRHENIGAIPAWLVERASES